MTNTAVTPIKLETTDKLRKKLQRRCQNRLQLKAELEEESEAIETLIAELASRDNK